VISGISGAGDTGERLKKKLRFDVGPIARPQQPPTGPFRHDLVGDRIEWCRDVSRYGLPALPTNQYLASFAVAEPHGGTVTVTEVFLETAALADRSRLATAGGAA
jgi:hypothetical protein